jgi:hypothetical protein
MPVHRNVSFFALAIGSGPRERSWYRPLRRDAHFHALRDATAIRAPPVYRFRVSRAQRVDYRRPDRDHPARLTLSALLRHIFPPPSCPLLAPPSNGTFIRAANPLSRPH